MTFHIQSAHGKTLLELLVVVVIIGLLASLTFPLYSYFKARASYVGCVNNLTSLHAGLSSHLADHLMVWPQVPEDVDREGPEGDMLAKFWYDTLKEYGVSKKTWVCSADEHIEELNLTDEVYESTYSVTEFDDQPNRAYQWAVQPWVVESGDFHGIGKGPNVIFPDGHIERGMSLAPPQ
jgi:prepilin-type N-terminal cleavage/methylation domain-containing protein